ncbi:hypothetical protein Tco_0096951 [Tanacetum coccineum]
MSTQQDIYAASFENRPPMLNKQNYVPWSSRLLRYAKSRPNEKLIYNSIINGPYVRRMIPEPGDQNREVPVNETFHEQTDDELPEKELKQVEADDQAIQTILLRLPEDIYAAVDSYNVTQQRIGSSARIAQFKPRIKRKLAYLRNSVRISDEIEEVNFANSILMANFAASIDDPVTQTDKLSVYDIYDQLRNTTMIIVYDN